MSPAQADRNNRNQKVAQARARARKEQSEERARERQEQLQARLGRLHDRMMVHQERHHRSRTNQQRPGALTAEEIVRTAVSIADRIGTQELSMRRLAAEMQAGTMSLYWHVENKDELVSLMFDSVIGQVRPRGVPSEDWREDVRRICTETRRVMLQHPWAIPLMAQYEDLTENTLRFAEVWLEVLENSGADMETVAVAINALGDYLAGSLLREHSEAEARERSGMTPEAWRESVTPYVREVIASGAFPHFTRFVMDAPHLDDPDERFETGLDFVIEGIAARIQPRKKRASKSAKVKSTR